MARARQSPREEASSRLRLDFPPDLPISARAEEIVATLQAHPVVILAGETGSGKTTQIPKLCLAAGRGRHGRIACTQPRRVAALSVSRRVAEELGVSWGGAVGCKVRFQDQTSSSTVIKFLTDGMLLAEVQGDPALREYDTIIIDEAHERSLNIDFLLGHLRGLRQRRPDLRIVITSATIDTATFSRAFEDAPVIEVSGRTFPVEVIYHPLDGLDSDYEREAEELADPSTERSARAEALHYIDGAVEAVERILRESHQGDVLVFMPSERDIRETIDLLGGRRGAAGLEFVPLFGRLSNAEQQRVFAASPLRKVIVATNIAETSLTIPGIRFVVDTGLARISRYAPQSRTRRLPIEPIAQSSADQRKGRAGRVAEGVCVRLYSEKDFNERPRFAQPEIQRANLADVILRMKAFGLGDIERFPFINAPATKAVRAGYALLEELGAWEQPERSSADEPAGESSPGGGGRVLSELGRELARLPVDPTVGRMILQARREKALREVVVIAAGLSIQDPRERPLASREKADAAHRRFAHPDSDFLTLLNIWDAFHDQWERMSQGRLRRFCREHYLSYTRLREWRDIHAQLLDVLAERGGERLPSVFDGLSDEAAADPARCAWGAPAYRAVHRSILAGLLGNIAVRDDERGGYKATHDRRIAVFPGSALAAGEARKGRPRGAGSKPAKGPRWLMAAEIMETSRLYARTCARLDPVWALELGEHLVRVTHSEPFWQAEGGRVLVKRRARLYGLELESRAVSYGPVQPVAATEIFIREGLVNDTVTWPLDCLEHNRRVRAEVEALLTRQRARGYLNLDEAVYRFYASHLLPDDTGAVPVSSVGELVDLVRSRQSTEPRFLRMTPEDLHDPDTDETDAEAYPEALPLANQVLPLAYAYKPGEADDGVSVDLPPAAAENLTSAALDWAVPGHLGAKVEHYLKALPKEWRRELLPLAETARRVTRAVEQLARLRGGQDDLTAVLAEHLRDRLRRVIDPAFWADKPLPDHLRVRVRVVDEAGRELVASRDLAVVRTAVAEWRRAASAAVAEEDPAAWRRARQQWERAPQDSWTFGDVPAEVPVVEQAGLAVPAYPGLQAGADGVALRLFRTAEAAAAATRRGWSALLERQLRYDLGWLQRDLRSLRELGPLTATLAPLAELQEQAAESLRRWIVERPPGPLQAPAFAAAVERARADLRGIVPRLVDTLRDVLTWRQTLLVHAQPYPELAADLEALVPPDFLAGTPYPQLAHLGRYLRAMKLRADRWRQHPAKDAERAKQLAPFVQARRTLESRRRAGKLAPELAVEAEAFRWLVEEFRVSLFAQELGTAEPVSAVKLERLWAQLAARAGLAVRAKVPEAEPTPLWTGPVKSPAEKKTTPLKSLSGLDALFRK